MTEHHERQTAFNRAIVALAYAPAISVTPIVVTVLIDSLAGLDAAVQQVVTNVGYLALILLVCGAIFMTFTSVYALNLFARKPKLSLGKPLPKRALWAFAAIGSAFINLLGLISHQLQSKYFHLFMGIDVLSGTLIYGSICFYIYAVIKVSKEKPNDL